MKIQRTKWVELPGTWFQKAYLNISNEIVFSYHYKSKNNPPVKFIEINTQHAKQLCAFKLIEKDLRDISVFLKEYDRLIKSHNNDFKGPNNTPTEGIIAKALLSSIAIHYFRCFPGSKGRKAHLQEQSISEKNIDAHNFLKEIRNKYIAHSDESDYESCKYVLLIPPRKKLMHGKQGTALYSFELKQAYGVNMFADKIQSLISELSEFANTKISQLSEKIYDEINLIPEEKVVSFIEKEHGNRIALTQKKLEYLLKK